jgi:hypothetical protein
LGDVRQRLLRHEDSPQGFVLPVQGLNRVEKEGFVGGVVDRGPPGMVTDFSSQPRPDDISGAQLEDNSAGAEVAGKRGNLSLRREERPAGNGSATIRKSSKNRGRPGKTPDRTLTGIPIFPGDPS